MLLLFFLKNSPKANSFCICLIHCSRVNFLMILPGLRCLQYLSVTFLMRKCRFFTPYGELYSCHCPIYPEVISSSVRTPQKSRFPPTLAYDSKVSLRRNSKFLVLSSRLFLNSFKQISLFFR